jgi:dethiobiotin synthetase
MTDSTPTIRRLGITGTDTGIGKTVVSCALAARARQLGVRVAAMKPAESGIEERPLSNGGVASDADRLRAACGNVHDLQLVRPYCLVEPLAPMVAAQRAGVTLDLAVLDEARAALEREHDLLLVEGAGGLLVPITNTLSYAGLFARWDCEVVVVAGNRLGVLNHVLLTVQAIEQAGLSLSAIVLTSLNDHDATVAEATNYDVLHQLLPGYPLFRFPWVDRVDEFDALALAAKVAGLDALAARRAGAALGAGNGVRS